MASIEVTSYVREVQNATEKAMKKAARMVGGSLAGHAAEACPVDTGLLRNSITFALGGQAPAITEYQSNGESKTGKKIEVTTGQYEGEAPADDDGEVTVYVGTNVEYAPFQELGTVKMSARPFLRPAFENNKEEIERIIEKCLKEVN